MRTKQIYLILAGMVSLLMLASCKSSVEISEKNFPDEAFREYVSDFFDGDDDGKLSQEEIENIVNIHIEEFSIQSLEGIELFTSLETLELKWTGLKTLDLTKCHTMKSLYCNCDHLESINVANCDSLEKIVCGDNLRSERDKSSIPLSSLNVTGCKSLKLLYCDRSRLQQLDLSGCSDLRILDCSNCDLRALDLSHCSSLMEVNCNNNSNLVSLNLPKTENLRKVDCSRCSLTELDISDISSLDYLNFRLNKVTTIDLSDCQNLFTLDCMNNSLSSHDLSKTRQLNSLDCAGNKLTAINVQGMSRLTNLNCGYNRLSSLDISGCSSLESINCECNNISSLNFSDCHQISSISINNNNIGSAAVDVIVRSLPNYGSVESGVYGHHVYAVNYPIYDVDPDKEDHNFYWTLEQVNAARAKGFRVWDVHGKTISGNMEMHYWFHH